MPPIKNVTALREAIAAGQSEFLVRLKYNVYSPKTITPCAGGRFRIENHVDGTVQRLTGRQLYTQSIIGDAMRAGAFVPEAPEPDDY